MSANAWTAMLSASLLFSLLGGTFFTPPLAEEHVIADRVLVKKSERKLYLLRRGEVLKAYNVSLGKNPTGHKGREGDSRTPEGEYVLDWRNPHSRFYLAIHISYPNEADRLAAEARGEDPGGDIMIHGEPPLPSSERSTLIGRDWTDGCIAVRNSDMEEIWQSVMDGTPIEIEL